MAKVGLYFDGYPGYREAKDRPRWTFEDPASASGERS
jgi:hypothetical protein